VADLPNEIHKVLHHYWHEYPFTWCIVHGPNYVLSCSDLSAFNVSYVFCGQSIAGVVFVIISCDVLYRVLISYCLGSLVSKASQTTMMLIIHMGLATTTYTANILMIVDFFLAKPDLSDTEFNYVCFSRSYCCC